MKTGMGSASGRLVEDNVVAISVNLFMAVKILQNENGIRSFNADIYPRSTGQVELFKKTIDTLESNGVTINHNSIDFKLLTEEEVSYLINHKEEALRILPQVVERFTAKYKDAIAEGSYDFQKIEADVNEIFQNLPGDRVAELMRKESIEAIKRSKKRGEESGRKDDSPLPLLKRLTDYFENSYSVPFYFEKPIIVATNSSPANVAKLFFCKYLDIPKESEALHKGGKYYNLLRRYQNLVGRRVNGEFIFVFKNRRLERSKDNYDEYLYWDKFKQTLFYTIVLKDSRAITYAINDQGTMIFEPEKNMQLAEEIGILLPSTETFDSFWLKRPELWGMGKSFLS